MREIVRKERPHPGAQLRITDIDGHRITAFATNTAAGGPGTQVTRAGVTPPATSPRRGPDPLHQDSDLRNLPLHDFTPKPDLLRDCAHGL
jgi:hypothetical protein